MNVWEETTEGKKRHWNEIKETKIGKGFAENQQLSESFVEACLQALTSQLWNIHWTLCGSSYPQVKEAWMRKERMNYKCNWSETQVTLECPIWNASARRVSCECSPRAGCRPKSHFYPDFFYLFVYKTYLFIKPACCTRFFLCNPLILHFYKQMPQISLSSFKYLGKISFIHGTACQ